AGAGHDVLREEAQRFGIGTYAQYETGRTVMQMLGKLVAFTGQVPKLPFLSLIALLRMQRRWERDMKTLPAGAPWTAPKAREWDAMTLETWIQKHVRTEAARTFARLIPRGAWCAEASQVSYLWFMEALRGANGLDYVMGIKGGGQD